MSKALAGVLSVVAAFSLGCSGTKRSQRTGVPRAALIFPQGKPATTKADQNGVLVASLDPNSTETQVVSASASSNIAGVSVAFPPGSLAVATDIVLQEGQKIENETLLADAGVANGAQVTAASAPVMITATQPIDLTVPMIISLALPQGAALLEDPTLIDRLAVVYRVAVQATGQSLAGVAPAKDLTLTGDKLLYGTLYFGWFQVTVFDRPVEKSEKEAAFALHDAVELILTGIPLPSCGKADLGRTVYVMDEKTFKYCSETGWTNIDLTGAKGDKGDKGDAGAAGTPGTNGTNGTSGTGFSLYDANAAKIGFVLGFDGNSAWVSLGSTASDRGTLRIDTTTGRSATGACSNGTCSCYFADNTCSGSCYLTHAPAKNAVFARAGGFVRAAGGAASMITPSTYLNYSLDSNGTCSGGGVIGYYAATSAYTLPSGTPSYPFTNLPLYVDP